MRLIEIDQIYRKQSSTVCVILHDFEIFRYVLTFLQYHDDNLLIVELNLLYIYRLYLWWNSRFPTEIG